MARHKPTDADIVAEARAILESERERREHVGTSLTFSETGLFLRGTSKKGEFRSVPIGPFRVSLAEQAWIDEIATREFGGIRAGRIGGRAMVFRAAMRLLYEWQQTRELRLDDE
jgi:hypothetical protein